MENRRLLFLDQARGYAVAGMILVNILGCFTVMPWMLKHHHEGFSYADHIAPFFIFLVGMGFRISFLKSAMNLGLHAARRKALRRYAILTVMGLAYGGFHLPVAVWDALTDIGVSGMLALPLIHRSTTVRFTGAFLFLAAYQCLYSFTGYGAWVFSESINGGPLGPLSWVFILLMGTVSQDLLSGLSRRTFLLSHAGLAILLSLAGWLLRAPWPGLKPLWHFSQYGMSAPYPLYATGLCFASLALFYAACELARVQFPPFTTLGKNALAVYLLQAVLVLLVKAIVPEGMGSSAAVAVFLMTLGLCYAMARYLELHGKILKIG